MQTENEWDVLRGERASRAAPAISPIRVALLFGSAAVAFALIAMSFLGGETPLYADAAPPLGLDTMTTGSITPARSYIIRKSVLQSSPDAVCYIYANGDRAGEC